MDTTPKPTTRFKMVKTADKNMWKIHTPVGTFWVFRHYGRSWSGRVGSHKTCEYRARYVLPDGTLLDMGPWSTDLCSSRTLVAFHRRFEQMVGQMECARAAFGE